MAGRWLRLGATFASLFVLACGEEGGGDDDGTQDAAPPDAAMPDAAPAPDLGPDAAEPDAAPDAAPPDAAPPADGAPPDAAVPDAAADAAPDAAPPAACANGADDDEDGATDYPADPGCEGPGDLDEADPETPACANGADDDADGLTDADDPGCAGPEDPSEADACGEAQRFRDVSATGRAEGDTRGSPAVFSAGCRENAAPEAVFLFTLRTPVARLVFDSEGSAFDTVLSLRTDCADPATERACNDDACPDGQVEPDCHVATPARRRTSRLVVDAPALGDHYVLLDGFQEQAGPYVLTVRAELDDGVPCPPEGGRFTCGGASVCREGVCARAACSNGADDDMDGVTDFPNEPGCERPDDDDEADPPSLPECFDRSDNDFDGRVDFPQDGDCDSAGDPSEDPPPQCSDGLDNDGDGFVDRADPGCTDPADGVEFNPAACLDRVDNDGDGAIDWPADPGCAVASDTDEADPVEAPACANGADDDGDGETDFPGDADGCQFAADPTEADPCANLQPIDISGRPLARGNLREGRNEFGASCAPNSGNEFVLRWRVADERPLASMRLTTRGTEVPVIIYVRDRCDADVELGCAVNRSYPYETALDLGPQAGGTELLLFVDGADGLTQGNYRLNVDARVAEGGRCDGGSWRCAEGLACRRDGAVSRCQAAACSNGADDDDDGLTDFPEEPGCATPEDDDERDPADLPQCSNLIDDDEDGLADFGEDLRCLSAGDDFEGPDCADGLDNDGDGAADYDRNGDGFPDFGMMDEQCACETDESEDAQPQCADQCDNDGDGLVDLADPGCASPEGNREFNVPHCRDGADNDGDGRIDFPIEPGCANADDPSEVDPEVLPACADGVDNDEDGRIDYPGLGGPEVLPDEGCAAAADNSEEGPCDLPQAPLPFEGVARGNTAALTHEHTGTCRGGQAPEAVFVATVPFPAHVVATTEDSDYDTVLYARSSCSPNATCGPDDPECVPGASTELACNDDAVGVQSTVELDWAGGDLFLFVDGFGSSSGPYVLTVRATYPVGGRCAPDGPAWATCEPGTACVAGEVEGEFTCQVQ